MLTLRVVARDIRADISVRKLTFNVAGLEPALAHERKRSDDRAARQQKLIEALSARVQKMRDQLELNQSCVAGCGEQSPIIALLLLVEGECLTTI